MAENTSSDQNSPKNELGHESNVELTIHPIREDMPEVAPMVFTDPIQVEEKCATGTLDLSINDWNGRPIPKLDFLVFIDKKVFHTGTTNEKGKADIIKDIPLGSTFEIRVKKQNSPKDDINGYKFAAIGKVRSADSYACLESPKTKFEFSTEGHSGTPGGADAKKTAIVSSHNQQPTSTPEISGNKGKEIDLHTDRDNLGRPKLLVLKNQTDWYGRNTIGSGSPDNDIGDLEKVNKLIEFAGNQATWKYSKTVTAGAYVKQMICKKFDTPESKLKDGYKNSVHMCAKYVKIALWYAGYGKEEEPIGNGVAAARDMGPALISAGFKDVTSKLPDARWAAPGDVIVYQRKNAPNEAGHIDIRTYDGYLSDFFGTYLPISVFKVTGIYRKYYDPLPEKLMRAFLMVIASRESKTIFMSDGYLETYRTLPASQGKPRDKFNDFSTHPFFGKPPTSSPSGAYGITVATWNNYIKLLNLSDEEPKFAPIIQDRIAIAIMEQTENALGLVRAGKIEEAATILARRKQWTSFPSGSENNGYTVDQMIDSHKKFMAQIK